MTVIKYAYHPVTGNVPFQHYQPMPCADCGNFPDTFADVDKNYLINYYQIVCPGHYSMTHSQWASCLTAWNSNMESVLEKEAVNG